MLRGTEAGDLTLEIEMHSILAEKPIWRQTHETQTDYGERLFLFAQT